MLAVLGLSAGRDADAVAYGQGEACRSVYLEPLRQFGRDVVPFADDQARSLRVAGRILMKLKQIAWIIFGGIGFLRVGQVRRNPCRDHPLLAQLSLGLKPGADGAS